MKMNCNEAKNIKIVDFLRGSGFIPQKIVNQNYWYCSMLRTTETKPSLKVDDRQNVWFDHGLGEGGNILDLVMKMNNINSVSTALRILSSLKVNSSISFHQQRSRTVKTLNRPNVKKVESLSNLNLINYLSQKRRIPIQLASRYCYEVTYIINDKSYYAVGFKNSRDGWELRNPFWKGCIGRKSYTHIENQNKSCCLFEGFMDFLSFMKLFPSEELSMDYVILNSLVNIKKAIPLFDRYNQIHCYLDNDPSGRIANDFLLKSDVHPIILDGSNLYKDFKDLNEYLLENRR